MPHPPSSALVLLSAGISASSAFSFSLSSCTSLPPACDGRAVPPFASLLLPLSPLVLPRVPALRSFLSPGCGDGIDPSPAWMAALVD